MKIAILTMVFNNNYGGMLQAYALQASLKKIGHNPILLNVQKDPKQTSLRKILSIIKRFIYKYILRKKNIYSIFYKKEKELFEKNTRYFISRYIQPTSHPLYREEDFKQLSVNEKFGAYIVGSDQVWRPTMYPYINQAFFGFLGLKNEKRLSYAASFGVDKWEYTEEQTQKYKRQIKLFDAVSVREDSGVALCEKYFDVQASHLIDPTMLLSVDDYKELVDRESESSFNGELLCYILDVDNDKKNVENKIKEQLNYKSFYTNVRSKEYDGIIADHVYPTVTSWLKGFIDAKFVFTDSFHGVVFSILFNKPFIVYGNSVRGFARFHSLLKMFGLEDRYIESSNQLTNERIMSSINWNEVNIEIEKQREKAYNFLRKNLNM